MIAISHLQKTIGPRTLFDEASFNLNPGERYGLVGANGSGKSTFLQILSGEDHATGGKLSFPKNIRLGLLRQDQFIAEGTPVIDCCMMGDKAVFEALRERESLLLSATASDINRMGELEDWLLQQDAYRLESRASDILQGLGIENATHAKPMSHLSGGFKLRVLLGQALVSRPDLLLLDEPTNHLDIITIRWLEKFLCAFRGCLVVTSHDKRFLENVSTSILDIDYQTITLYSGDYAFFERAKKLKSDQLESQIASINREIAQKQAFIDRFRAKASKARQAQSRMKQIEKIEMPELKTSSRRSPSFSFEQVRSSGKEVLKVSQLAKSFDERHVLHGVSFFLRRGDRLAIIGPNGIGKSTLLKILVEQLQPDLGEISWGHETQLGYFAQDSDASLAQETHLDIVGWLYQFAPHLSEQVLRGYLGRALFSGDDVKKSVRILSGGELARLNLARIMLLKPNVLLLDEPTNHLDIEAIESLVTALQAYAGTLIFVSHDRWFVSSLATRILEITREGINDFQGGFADYLAASGDDHLDVQTALTRAKKSEKPPPKAKDFNGLKENKLQFRQIESDLTRTTQSLQELENRLKAIEAIFCGPNFFRATPPQEIKSLEHERREISTKRDALFAHWETLESQLAKLRR